MRYSQLLIPTVKEVPAEAEIISHQLMIRAGFVRKVASGTYTYLALGWRSLKKIIEIVRQEMDAAGAQEILMPILQPLELWQKTGRDVDYGQTMCKFTDRHQRENVLAPTAEEVVTTLVANEVSSYKQLPVNLYQVHDKFRDEFRPRFGALRSREFIMKDGYSFDASLAGLEKTYQAMYDAYRRIFTRCGLRYVIVEAESGPIGGSASHEFMVACQAGEDIILVSDKSNYAANVEKAAIGGIPGEYSYDPFDSRPAGPLEEVHTPDSKTIADVCKFMKIKPRFLLKTLVLKPVFEELPGVAETPLTLAAKKVKYIVAVLRGDIEINLAKVLSDVAPVFKELGRLVKKVDLVDPLEAEKDGVPIGFVGPHIVSGREDMVLIADHSVLRQSAAAEEKGPFWVAGANKKDYHVKYFNWSRDVADLARHRQLFAKPVDMRNAREGDLSPMNDGGVLRELRGIEVGHVFKLGTKYSTVLGAKFVDEAGKEQPCIMGCYGIGINRILAGAIEMDSGHDVNGCVLPISIAPFEVEVLPLNMDKPAVKEAAEKLYAELRAAGADVLLDDRDERAGVKFKDSDLIGMPLRIVVGERNLNEGKVEIKRRTDAQATVIPADGAVAEALRILREMKEAVAARK
jgi:prolyl-tRNA synthetase